MRALTAVCNGFAERVEGAPPQEAAPIAARVLVAEDNAVNQVVAVRMLERMGCRVDVAASGLDAVACATLARYDVIFMDCQMPELDGYGATAEIRRLESGGARTPIVAMTANAMEGDRQRCLAAGMDGYLSKPVRAAELRAAVVRWATPKGRRQPDTISDRTSSGRA